MPNEIVDSHLSEYSPDSDGGFDGGAEAARFQERLHEHFLSLSKARLASGLPVFALEHGLSEGEFALLQTSVRWLVKRRETLRQTPLPLVVYAAEIGYRYDGGEIWPIFFDETPGWVDKPHTRARIKEYFMAFAEEYSGAVPTGAWARQFSIICWPVIHAVLPKVFQRQLVEILYHNRFRLTSNVIEDSERLGLLIEGASWGASDRFRNLAQNHALIGQVATALLTADDTELADDDTLLQSTVRQIVSDLSLERTARTFLREAQAATRTSFMGLRSPATRPSAGGRVERQIDVVDPQLRLLRSTEGWRLILELQDLSPLVQRYPVMNNDFLHRRCRINGAQRVLPRSALLWPGQRVELTEPLSDEPLLQLIGASDRTNGHLSDYCKPPPPPWLFHVEDGEGSVVLGRFVRPGSSYVLVTPDELTLVSNMVELGTGSVSGLGFYRIEVPEDVADADIEVLDSLGISTQTAIRVWPAGLANAGWNGEDVAVWLEGDPIVIGLDTDRKVDHLIITIDGDAQRASIEDRPTFLDLGTLSVGHHNVDFEAFASDATAPVAKESIRVDIRPRSIRPGSGSLREGLVLLTSPSAPSLTDLLSGAVEIEVLGPPGETVTARVALLSRSREIPLAENAGSATLPVSSDESLRLVSRLLRQERVHRHLEESDMVRVAFSHRDIGTVEVLAERLFTPLRWIVSHDDAHPVAQLIDNMDGVSPEVEFRTLSQPDSGHRLDYDSGTAIRLPDSGLLTATANDFSISTVVTPGTIRDFADLGARGSTIEIERRNSSADSLQELVDLASLWRMADKPDLNASLVARRVLEAISVEVASGIGGRYWARVEHRRFKIGQISDDEMIRALGVTPSQRLMIEAVRRSLPAPESMNLRDLVATFSSIVQGAESSLVHSDISLGEFCLRIASQPSSVADLDSNAFRYHAISMIENPITLRLARYIVFRVDDVRAAEFRTEAPYEGFVWT